MGAVRSIAPPVDLAIVGASFAGLACARTAALLGLSVAVIDAKPEPGARVHTTGILVREVIDDMDLPAALMRRVRGVRLYGAGRRPLDLWAPGYYFAATDTADLLRWLAGETRRAGAELWLSTRLVGLSEDATGVRLDLTTQGEAVSLRARHVVGADGARSVVARHAGLGVNRHWLTGLELGFAPTGALAADAADGPGIDRRFLHCFLTTRHAPGYIGWVVPGPSVIQVGLAATRTHRPDLPGFLGHVADRLGVPAEALAPHTAVERRAGRIPVGGRVAALGTRRIVLTGDAAGLVSPLTGGGIRMALASGRRAALAVVDHLVEGGPPPAEQVETAYPRLANRRWLRRMIESPHLVHWVARSLDTPVVRAAARRIFFHRTRMWPLTDATARTAGPFSAGDAADHRPDSAPV